VRLGCAVSFNGSKAPSLEFYPSAGFTISYHRGSTLLSITEVVATSQLYSCYVSFDGAIFPYASNQTIRINSGKYIMHAVIITITITVKITRRRRRSSSKNLKQYFRDAKIDLFTAKSQGIQTVYCGYGK